VLLRGSLNAPEIMSHAKKGGLVARTLKLQHADGGWSVALLGDRTREGNRPTDKSRESDGYGTAFALYTLCKTGTPANTPAIQKGLMWLKTNQRESGRRFTASLWSDAFDNYVSHIGTAYAVMALKVCGKGA
jgi:squalene-hopene/tetraprenyl-beta-curcumene cyclase